MIGTLWENEVAGRRTFIWVAITIACIVAASMPSWFDFSLRRAATLQGNEVASAVLVNFRSFPRFVETQWAGRSLPQLLFLIALITGAGAIAGEREARTLPLLRALGVPLQTVVAVKYLVYAALLSVAALSCTTVIAVHALIRQVPVSWEGLIVATLVALLNACAFLAIVFAGSALASRAVIGGVYGLLIGVVLVALFWPFGINAMELGGNLFGTDGALNSQAVVRAVASGVVLLGAGLAATFTIVRRRAG